MRTQNKRETKEYMKYEDGKIVTIEVEPKTKFQPVDHYPQEDEPGIAKTQQLVIKIRGLITKQRLKYAGYVLLLLLFILSVVHLYKVFNETPSTSDQPSPGTSISAPSTTPLTAPSDKPNGAGSSIQPSSSTSDNNETSSLSDLLKMVDYINTSMVKTANGEIDSLTRYNNNQTNYIVVNNALQKSLSSKEDLLKALMVYKPLFEEEGILDFYTVTKERLDDSINFTKSAQAALSTSQSNLQVSIDNYPKTDETLRLKQQDELIKMLNDHGIPYMINEKLNQVEYSIS